MESAIDKIMRLQRQIQARKVAEEARQTAAEAVPKQAPPSIPEAVLQADVVPTPAPDPPVGKVIQLPTWPDSARGCPSCVLRSALFGVVQRGQRFYLKREKLTSWHGTTIRYTGERLDQSDLDVWLLLLHMARGRSLGESIRVTGHSLLKALGRCSGKRDYEWLKEVVSRLVACVVEITVGNQTYGGSLIQEFQRDELTGHYLLVLNPKMVLLFQDQALTLMEWETRHGLSKDLAKWLHGYIVSHMGTVQEPYRFNLQELKELCGSSTGEMWKFRQQIRLSMGELQEQGVVTAWRITEEDCLEFIRPSASPRFIAAEAWESEPPQRRESFSPQS